MGRATADLSDPQKSSSAPGAPLVPLGPAPIDAATADDLLSQLAGEEIDRLLAEADAMPKSDDAPPAAPVEPAAAVAIPTPAPAVVQGPPALAPDTEKEIEAVLKELGGDELTKYPAPVPPPVAPEPTRLTSSAARAGGGATADAQTQGAERAALTAVVEADEVAQLIEQAHSDADAPTPFYLKPLEWLNAPLMACPEAVRELLGKVAIITLLNAVAVIVYVMMFRKK